MLELSNGLIVSAGNGNIKAVKRLLKAGADVNETDRSGCTPLHHASNNGHSEIVKMLLKAGADVNKSDKNGE